MNNTLLQSIRNQILKYEKENSGLHGKINIYIPQPDVIQTLNILIKYRLNIIHVENNCVTIKFGNRADKSFLQDTIRLENLDINWTVSKHYNSLNDFSKDFKSLNPYIQNKDISSFEKLLDFKITLPYEQITNRNGNSSYRYKADYFTIPASIKTIYDLICTLNNLIFDKIKNFKNIRFEISKFEKVDFGYCIKEKEDIPF